ncbi:MAG TPA: proton-conducting transporter membrane subunit, partial [Pseudohongiella sp.]|nr:proton-conducting transporter membrane subunit [Pseudohongiella sp.]
MTWLMTSHLIILPVLLPLLVGAYLVPVNETRHDFKFMLNLGSMLIQLVIAISLLVMVDTEYWEHGIGVYLAANWVAPFGIVLMVDRLSALMLVLTAVLGTSVLIYSMSRWSRIGVHFHSLFQFLMMGLNGAFLTHDLFNLFVFFEVMLAASYGLLLHGYNLPRIRAGMQFIAINLLASLMFLIGVTLIYAATGTLNMSDIALKVSQPETVDIGLMQLGTALL